MPSPFLILTALNAEAKALRRAGTDATVIGIRACRLANAIVPPQARTIIMAGVGGGLDPQLKIGDVVIDELSTPSPGNPGEGRGEGDFERTATLANRNHPRPKPLPEYRERGPENIERFRRGTIHTVGEILSTPAAKAALFAATHAAVVDMEQSIVKKWADAHSLPLIGIRAISDTAAHFIDPAVMRFVDEIGNIKPMAVAKSLLCHPTMVGPLMRLGRNTNIALAALVQTIRRLDEPGFIDPQEPALRAATKPVNP